MRFDEVVTLPFTRLLSLSTMCDVVFRRDEKVQAFPYQQRIVLQIWALTSLERLRALTALLHGRRWAGSALHRSCTALRAWQFSLKLSAFVEGVNM